MKCPNCRKKVQENEKFCSKCGTKLSKTKEEASPPLPPERNISRKESKKKQKRPFKKFCAIVFLCLFVSGMIFVVKFKSENECIQKLISYFTDKKISTSASSSSANTSCTTKTTTTASTKNTSIIQKHSDNIVKYSNGDIVAKIETGHIVSDDRTSIQYIDNRIVVYTMHDFTAEEINSLLSLVDGTLIGDISGVINMLQIEIAPSSLEEINHMAGSIMKQENIIFAGYDYPIQPTSSSFSDTNPWELNGNSITADERTPDGNNWWAEAIGAYSAWQYTNLCQPVKIGVLDSGFDIDHKDLKGQISILEGFPVNSESNHGTHVAGIIGAINNNIGMRGIADTAKIIAADWSPTEEDNLLASGEYIEILKQMIEQGICVINNSWSTHILSEKGYAKYYYYDGNEKFSAHGYYEKMEPAKEPTSITIKSEKNKKGEQFSKSYSFIENDANKVNFYINNKKKSLKEFMNTVSSKKGEIYIVQKNSYVSDVYYVENKYSLKKELEELKKEDTYGYYKDYKDYMHCQNIQSRRTSLDCMIFISEILKYNKNHNNKYDKFIIVQAAGNGYDNGGKGYDTKLTGFFCGLDEGCYNRLSQTAKEHYAKSGITYKDIDDRIMIVGAVENKKNYNGFYYMTDFSNYGNNIDICAPGKDIFSTIINNTYTKYPGTSVAAPMVSGAVALLWQLNPSLSAAEVKQVLLQNTSTSAVGVNDNEGTIYPMLNIGMAAKEVLIENIKFESQYEKRYNPEYNMDTTYQFAVVSAYKGNGKLAWKYQTPSFQAAELDSVYEIGQKENAYYLYQGGSIASLNVSDGSVLWETDAIFGFGNSLLGEDCIYLTGYYGPDFSVLSYDGKLVKQINTLDPNCYWAYKIEGMDNIALVYLEGSESLSQDAIFEVNLTTWEYRRVQ